VDGTIVYPAVADAFGLTWEPVDTFLR
jgi:hypothetical protein